MNKLKTLTVLGTRPEAIKLSPVINLLKKDSDIQSLVCSTNQHEEMLKQAINLFSININYSLKLFEKNRDLFSVTSNMLVQLKNVMKDIQPDVVIVQGDTITAFIASLAAFYEKINIAHIEAGLRSFNKFSPFPEEMNRKMITVLADFHFAPTKQSEANLKNEGIDAEKIFVTGNTVVDSLMFVNNKFNNSTFAITVKNNISKIIPSKILDENYILLTLHRREKFGWEIKRLFEIFKSLASNYRKYSFIFPVHLNPNILKPAREILSKVQNFYLLEPLDYSEFTYLMKNCRFLMTDSGGIQEECYFFSKPALVIRDVTERTEAINAGYVFLAASRKNEVLSAFERIDTKLRNEFNFFPNENPYGDGRSSEKIVNILKKYILHKKIIIW